MLKKLPLIKSLMGIWTKIDFIKKHRFKQEQEVLIPKKRLPISGKKLPFCPEEEAQKLKTFFKVMDAGFKQCPGFL